VDSFEVEYKVQSVLMVLEAVAYLGLAWWCLNRGSGGRWAKAVGAGAALVGLVLGLSAAAAFEQIFFDSTEIYEQVFFHQHISTVFVVARLAGALLLVAGVVESRRTPPRTEGSLYGP
jgi:hypothetical protein